MHLIGEDTAFTYSFLWRKYDKDYILHCLAQCIAHNVGIGLAEVMNNLFTSKHN